MRVVRRSAFSLVEVTLALGVAAFCLLALFGLLPIGVKADRQAIAQSTATDILSSVYSDLKATPVTSNCQRSCGVSEQFKIDFAGPKPPAKSQTLYFDGNGILTTDTSTSNPAVYRLTISLPDNGTATNKGATFVDLKLTWPALVDPAVTPADGVETLAAFDRNY